MPTVCEQKDLIDLLGNEGADELTFQKAIKHFESIYMASRNLSQRTRVEYRTDLNQLTEFLAKSGITKPADVGLYQLQAFLADLDVKRLTGVARRRKVASIRALFGFLLSSRFISQNPTRQLIPPQREYEEPRYLTRVEYQALLQACNQEPRDLALIELLLQTGLRLSELTRLSIHDIELPLYINRDPSNAGNLVVRGRGRRERTLPLNYKACNALQAWLSIRPNVPSQTLFVTKFDEPMGPRAIQDIVTKYLKDAGIKGASVHSLRHTFGVHHAMKGTDLKTIQAALGHADERTTSIYLTMAKEAMKRQLQDHAL
jgi:site-specific recombinase XerD